MKIISDELLNDIVHILQYFKDGLSDIKTSTSEEQPMLPEIKTTLKKLNKL